jgi:hypothetical protein
MARRKMTLRMNTGGCARPKRPKRRRRQELEPERILSHRVSQYNLIELHIKWRGFPINASTWEPLSALRDCPGVLDNYYRGPVEFEPHMILGHRIVHTVDLHDPSDDSDLHDPSEESALHRIVHTDDLENLLQLRVRWKGYAEETWEPVSALATCKEVQMDYYRDKPWAPMSPEFAQYFQEQMDIEREEYRKVRAIMQDVQQGKYD